MNKKNKTPVKNKKPRPVFKRYQSSVAVKMPPTEDIKQPTWLKYDENKGKWIKLYDKMSKVQLIEEIKFRDRVAEQRQKGDAEAMEFWNKRTIAREKEAERQIKALSGVVHVMAALKGEALPKEAVKVLVSMAIMALDDFKYGSDDEDDDPFNDIGQLKSEQDYERKIKPFALEPDDDVPF